MLFFSMQQCASRPVGVDAGCLHISPDEIGREGAQRGSLCPPPIIRLCDWNGRAELAKRMLQFGPLEWKLPFLFFPPLKNRFHELLNRIWVRRQSVQGDQSGSVEVLRVMNGVSYVIRPIHDLCFKTLEYIICLMSGPGKLEIISF